MPFAFLILLLFSALPPAASAGTLTVTARDEAAQPVADAEVVLSETGALQLTGADGKATFADVAAGTYHVSVRRAGFLGSRSEVTVADAAPATLDVSLAEQVHFTESVTVSPDARDTFESYQPAAVISGEELQQRLGGTLGETLSTQIGVNMRALGPGPSRPVIRGLDGDRVLVLENGARTGDISSQSGDHGVPLDPASAQQIEVVRGPATLLYGSNALGGVVNVVSDAIPTQRSEGFHGGFVAQGASANEEAGGAGSLTWGRGAWVLRAEGAARRTDDVDTPEGTIPNSDSALQSGGFGVSRILENGSIGASYAYDHTEYGVPFLEEGRTFLNPRRHRADVRAERRQMAGWIEGLKVQLGFRDYRHDEAEREGEEHEGEEEEEHGHGTQFHNRMAEAQLMLNHRPTGRLKGTFGGWFTTREFSAQGAEALAPPTDQSAFAGFFYEELPLGHVTLQAGGRVDHTSFTPEGLPKRGFTELSASLGVLGYLKENVTVAVNFARAARNPSLEELYNNGPHPGNFSFEVGNPDLESEVGYGVDLSLRWRSRRFIGELTVFRNQIDRFIFPLPTGDEEDGLPVVRFVAADSAIQGFEGHVDIGLTDNVWVEVGGDAVRGERRDTDDPLPRMPPLRAWVGLRYERNGFHLEGEVRTAAKQDRIFGGETPTDGYTLGNIHGAYTFAAGRTAHTLTVRVDNVGDTTYRNHLSFIKDLAPETGRSFKAVYSVKF